MSTDRYPFREIEAKWQRTWEETKQFRVQEDPSRPKFYCLEMFPYPSGRIHMGHVRVYAIGDLLARFKWMRGYNVLHPMGWDAFGLPAENAAIEHGVHPAIWTYENIDYMRSQLMRMGISYDWDREVATCDPTYYKWEQLIFIKMLERGLAYRKRSTVNWCPSCQTVLANEQVEDGHCWRCDSVVTPREIDGWFFKITDYAEELLAWCDRLPGWPERVLTMQRNWIGKSEGAEFDLRVDGRPDLSIRVFTTRPDTVFGMTYAVLAPEHPLVDRVVGDAAERETVTRFRAEVSRQSEIERTAADRPKRGLRLSVRVVNPFTNTPVPLFLADYVLIGYGTGAIMAVPGEDERDWEFAEQRDLPAPRRARPARDRHEGHLRGVVVVLPPLLLAARRHRDVRAERGRVLDAGRSVHRRHRARGAPPALRAVLHEGAPRPRAHEDRRALHGAAQPGHGHQGWREDVEVEGQRGLRRLRPREVRRRHGASLRALRGAAREGPGVERPGDRGRLAVPEPCLALRDRPFVRARRRRGAPPGSLEGCHRSNGGAGARIPTHDPRDDSARHRRHRARVPLQHRDRRDHGARQRAPGLRRSLRRRRPRRRRPRRPHPRGGRDDTAPARPLLPARDRGARVPARPPREPLQAALARRRSGRTPEDRGHGRRPGRRQGARAAARRRGRRRRSGPPARPRRRPCAALGRAAPGGESGRRPQSSREHRDARVNRSGRAPALGLALLAVGLTGCGYSFRGNLPDHIKTVAVPVFTNKTAEPAVETLLTSAVVQAFASNGRLRVVKPEEADAVLDGEVVGYSVQSIAFDNQANVRQYRLVVTMNLRLRDVKKSSILFEEQSLREKADFQVLGAVSQTISGEEAAVRTAASEIARSIVSLTIDRF